MDKLKGEKEMNDLKIGDRVKVVSKPKPNKTIDVGVLVGMTGTVKDLDETYAGVEFDDYMGGHNGSWNGKNGYCWYIPYERLEKIEETKEEVNEETKADTKAETKSETMEQKILTALREEIGVDIGEEFDVYENGEKQWTCKFEENGFFDETNGKFRETGLWKNIIRNFQCFNFKRKPFIPSVFQEYFYLCAEDLGDESLFFDVEVDVWSGSILNYGMLALGNVFRNEEEALKSRDEMLERLEKLRNGE